MEMKWVLSGGSVSSDNPKFLPLFPPHAHKDKLMSVTPRVLITELGPPLGSIVSLFHSVISLVWQP